MSWDGCARTWIVAVSTRCVAAPPKAFRTWPVEVIVQFDVAVSIGAPPDFGFLLFYIQSDVMKAMPAGNYVADIVGRDAQYSRKTHEINLTIVEGVTKWPSPA